MLVLMMLYSDAHIQDYTYVYICTTYHLKQKKEKNYVCRRAWFDNIATNNFSVSI